MLPYMGGKKNTFADLRILNGAINLDYSGGP